MGPHVELYSTSVAVEVSAAHADDGRAGADHLAHIEDFCIWEWVQHRACEKAITSARLAKLREIRDIADRSCIRDRAQTHCIGGIEVAEAAQIHVGENSPEDLSPPSAMRRAASALIASRKSAACGGSAGPAGGSEAPSLARKRA